MTCITRRTAPWLMMAALALLMLVRPGWATDTEPAQQHSAPATVERTGDPEPAPEAASGMVVFIDPATGRQTAEPTPEQRMAMQAALAAALDRSDAGLYDVVLPDGTVMRDLQGRFQHAVVLRVLPDGTRVLDCVTTPEAAGAPADSGSAAVTSPVATVE